MHAFPVRSGAEAPDVVTTGMISFGVSLFSYNSNWDLHILLSLPILLLDLGCAVESL